MSNFTVIAAIALGTTTLGLYKLFAVPKFIRHIPHVPLLPTLWSYAKGEVEDIRIKKLLMPFSEHGEPAVLVKVSKEIAADIDTFPKEVPPDGLLLWHLVGLQNVILANGEAWKRHSKVVKTALNRNVPIGEFASLAKKLFKQMNKGGLLQWDDYTMRYTLDAVGTTAMGHDFDMITHPESAFVVTYNHVMEAIASPPYLIMPRLEKWLPRHSLIAQIDKLVSDFQNILMEKKTNPGNDMITYMLEDKDMTDAEYRDNMVVFFIAGHDTTAGAMSSMCYYMAKNPDIQCRAREEVRATLAQNPTGKPTLAEFCKMPYLQACIRESLRVNTPITQVVPRAVTEDTVLVSDNGKQLLLPQGSSVIMNITSIHYNDNYWPDATEFKPERFMGMSEGTEKEYDASQWLPFSLGPRQCPAWNFAMYEQKTLGAMLLNEWEWTLPEESEHKAGIKNGFSPFALLLPKNLYLNFKRV